MATASSAEGSVNLVKAALSTVLSPDSKFSQDSDRGKEVRAQTAAFISALSGDRHQAFADRLVNMLKRHLQSVVGRNRSEAVLKEKYWIEFHKIRNSSSEVSKLWSEIDSSLSLHVSQHVNYQLYTELIKSLGRNTPAVPRASLIEIPELNEDEENVLRYAAGFVPFKLLSKYEKSDSEFSLSVIECLSNLSINGDESSLMEYTRKWTMEVNRGRLFEINDMAYALFREIELKVRHHLFTAFQNKSKGKREELITAVVDDEEVQFYWTILSVDISVEIHAIKLLEEIVGLWVNIRGFSIAGGWLEQYKAMNKVSTRKKKALRKDLKQKATSTSESNSQ